MVLRKWKDNTSYTATEEILNGRVGRVHRSVWINSLQMLANLVASCKCFQSMCEFILKKQSWKIDNHGSNTMKYKMFGWILDISNHVFKNKKWQKTVDKDGIHKPE